MSRRKQKLSYTAIVCLVLIGFIVWTFFAMTVGKEEPEKQKEISVVLYHTNKDGWESLQEGMKQAEDDFSVNINYVILQENASGAEQIAAVEREIANGAAGILLAANEQETWNRVLSENKYEVPLLFVESGIGNEMQTLISADNYAMGYQLGEEILEDFADQENLVVAVEYGSIKRDSVALRKQGLNDALEGKAQIISLSVALGGEKANAAAALHKDSALSLAEKREALLPNTLVYSIGNTSAIVAALDQEKIHKLIFQNEFNMGYLGVKNLLDKINGKKIELQVIDHYCVSRKELYTTQYEPLLFPMVE